jgi:hypothetical protein
MVNFTPKALQTLEIVSILGLTKSHRQLAINAELKYRKCDHD